VNSRRSAVTRNAVCSAMSTALSPTRSTLLAISTCVNASSRRSGGSSSASAASKMSRLMSPPAAADRQRPAPVVPSRPSVPHRRCDWLGADACLPRQSPQRSRPWESGSPARYPRASRPRVQSHLPCDARSSPPAERTSRARQHATPLLSRDAPFCKMSTTPELRRSGERDPLFAVRSRCTLSRTTACDGRENSTARHRIRRRAGAGRPR
jgi:hypothetical protein